MCFSVGHDRKWSRTLRQSGNGASSPVVCGAVSVSVLLLFLSLGVAPAVATNHVNTPPEISVTDHSLASGTVVPASRLFEIGDAQGVATVTEIEITDASGGGVFGLDGGQFDGVTFTVPAAAFSALTFTAGSPGSESITARASDGAAWSEAVTVRVTTSAGAEGVIVDVTKGEVFLPGQGWLAANAFFEFYYANAEVFSDAGYAQPLEALRDFVK